MKKTTVTLTTVITVLVNLVGGTTIRMAPPLTVTRTEVRAALGTFRDGVREAVSVPALEAAVA